ncbi:MAG TPA: glycosyltransferase family 2 protein [Flavobacteriales bacterium]|nr:glycosyltransferase family 2 protein [Flavobacteriales bacterium]HNM68205.1 glycosyltransferase family 2 protein [Flavobacteriales bacterium]
MNAETTRTQRPVDPRLLVTNAAGPLISIILPARNAAPYLRECIDSVLAQTWSNWELLIVDNASTDGTHAIATSYSDPRISVFSESRRGVSPARNKGLAAMKGGFFCFLDADDRLPQDALRLRHDLFLRYPEARFADGAMRGFDHRTGKTLWVRSPWFVGMPFDALMALDGSCFAGNTWMVRRLPGYDYRLPEHMDHSEDCAFYLGIARQGRYVSTAREVLHYRVGHPSATRDPERVHQGYIELYRNMRAQVPPPSPEQLTNAWRRLRRFMTRDLLLHHRPWAALHARLMRPPRP